MKTIFKKVISAVVSTAVVSVSVPFYTNAVSKNAINVNYHTAEEIAEYITSHPFGANNKSVFDAEPNYTKAPYSIGKLSDETLQEALNALNTVRFIAGVDEVTLSDDYNELAQAGTLVNAVNNKLSHFPSKPEDMSDELFEKCEEGTSSSNIGWGYTSLVDNIFRGWMSDSDESNIDRLGHRRWCINPPMKQTGFGNTGKYYAMYSFDSWSNKTDYSGVYWPAHIMPKDYFANDDPWSISMGYEVNTSGLTVKLTRTNDGAEWNFSEKASDGYFNVNNDGYGQEGCIIFRPDDISYKSGDSFEVTIKGNELDISYTVDFVDVFSRKPEISKASLTETDNFIINKKCDYDNVIDFNNDNVIDVFDSVYAKRKLTVN